MWRETIAVNRRSGAVALRMLAARLVTGPGAFLLAGTLDLISALLWLRRARRAAARDGRR